jgi:hypothetical protein
MRGAIINWPRGNVSYWGLRILKSGPIFWSRWNCPAIVQDASIFCQENAFEFRTPMSLGTVVKTASLLADANAMSMFGSNHHPAFAPELLGALSIQNPATFIEVFRTEYNGFQSCVTGDRTLVTR